MKLRKWLLMGLGFVAILVISFIGGGYIYLRSTLPAYDGIIRVEGIDHEIEIIRDSFGMPHIYGASDKDAAFALGFCTAQDRLFQMDMIRRSVNGRMSEIIGPKVLEVDRLFRTITAARTPEQFLEMQPPEVIEQLEAFSAGVNQYLTQQEDKLPFEFALLGYRPEPWKPADCLTMLYYIAWALNFSFDSELLSAAIANKVGQDMAAEIFIDYPVDAPTTIPAASVSQILPEIMRIQRQARGLAGLPFRGASNNWVIDGSRSITGSPLLANDMHLGLNLPGIWYEAHLATSDMNISGVIIPGTPFIVAGANDHIAWGFTNVMADESDFYLEEINPNDSGQYRIGDEWENFEVMYDTIKVKNDDNVILEIRITRHGVIVNDLIPDIYSRNNDGYLLSLRWSITDAGREAEALYRLNRADGIDDIEKASELYKCPGLNWVYADRDGNIGFTAAAGIPIRNGFNGRNLLAGWDGKHEWSGYVLPDELPRLKNPPSGWIATANNKTTGDDYPYYITHSYAIDDRFVRISQMLTEKENLGLEDFKKMQADDYLMVGEHWLPFLVTAFDGAILDKYEQAALDMMEDWDFYSPPTSGAAAIFHVTYQKIVENIFKERLGDSLYSLLVQEGTFIIPKAVKNLTRNSFSDWWDDPSTPDKENIYFTINKSFKEAILFLRNSLGDDVADWQWGKLHRLALYHPIGQSLPIIGNFMNIGPIQSGGGINSVNAAIYSLAAPYDVRAGASQRYIFDLGDINKSVRVLPAGISGNFMSEHYDDQFDLWKTVRYRPFVLDRSLIEKNVTHRMSIVPADNIVKDSLIN